MSPYDTEHCKESLADFALTKDLTNFIRQAGKIFLYQSKDDTEVSCADVEKYKRDIPGAILEIFDDRGHFAQEKFPEFIKDIKNLAN